MFRSHWRRLSGISPARALENNTRGVGDEANLDCSGDDTWTLGGALHGMSLAGRGDTVGEDGGGLGGR